MFQSHVIAMLKAKFNVEVKPNYLGYAVWDDEGRALGYDDSFAFAAAMDYAACYDGTLFDRLDAMQGNY